jgi:hypothetical protein
MNQNPSGSTRPFGLLLRCVQLGFAALALLQPDLALAASSISGPMLRLLKVPA